MTLWVRLKAEVTDRLGPRLMEWQNAFILLLAGYTLSAGTVVLDNVRGQLWWGVAFLVLGLTRLISLLVNGIRRRTTAWARAASAFFSSGAFLFIGIGYLVAGKVGIVVAVFPVIALFEWFNYGRAMRDVGRAS